MRRIALLMLFCLMTVSAFAQQPPIKVLIVDGYSNHDWRLTTQAIQSILAKHGGFDVTVSTVPTTSTEALAAWDPHFSNYDVVLQNCNDLGHAGPRWPRNVEKELEDYVGGGGGLYVYHSANNAFEGWPEYNKMIGLGWRGPNFGKAVQVNDDGTTKTVPAGEGGGASHGPRRDALVTCIGDHPIHAGLPRQFLAADTEVYTWQRGPAENLSVISYAEDARSGVNQPAEWVVRYGQGRVYASVFGHVWPGDKIQPSAECVAYQTLLPRGLEWLARRQVDQTAPADFPTAEKISLRESPVPGMEGKKAGYTTTKGYEVWAARDAGK